MVKPLPPWDIATSSTTRMTTIFLRHTRYEILQGACHRLCNEQLTHAGASEITIRWTSSASPHHARAALNLMVSADGSTAQTTILLS